MITEDYVSFEIAKLLNTKGFKGEFHKHYWGYKPGKEFLTDGSFNPEYDYPAPTLQIVMKWLRENHKLHIVPAIEYKDNIPYYYCGIEFLNTFDTMIDDTYYEKAENACEAAIKYCLENLI